MTTEYKEICSWSYDPTNSIFKHKKSDRGSFTVLSCNGTDTCAEYKEGRCIMKDTVLFGNQICPCGRISRTESPTPRAKNYSDFFRRKGEFHKDTYGIKLKPSEHMSYIGNEYVYIPIPHTGLLTECTELKHITPYTGGGYFSSQSLILSRADFTADNIILMLRMIPRAAFGGIITDYQQKSVPKFVQQLRQLDMNLYAEVVNLMTEEEKSRLVNLSNVGRTAILETLNPNVGVFVDWHGATWTWDGEWMHSFNSAASLVLVKFTEIKIKPCPGEEVTITDDGQVNENTKFTS